MNKLATTQILGEVLKKKLNNEDIEKFLWSDDEDVERNHQRSKFLLHPRNFNSESEIDEQEPQNIKKKELKPSKSTVKTNKTSVKVITPGKKVIPPKEIATIGDGKDVKGAIKKDDMKNHKKNDPAKLDIDKKIMAYNFEKKFPQLATKTLKLLNDIRAVLERGIQPPDGDEDEQRRLKRLQEFALRFSRNYIYPLLRQMDEVLALDKDSANLNQKILLAYSPINLGLQAYYNFLPNSIGKCATDKLKTVVDQLLHLVEIQEQQKWGQEIVQLLRENIDILLEVMNTFNKKNDPKNNSSKKSTKNKKKPTTPSNTKLQARISANLSVYAASSSFRKDDQFRRTVDFLSKKKYNVKSRYLTALFKHRPPTESKYRMNVNPTKSKIFPNKRSSTTILRNTPIDSPVNEDTIETMIGIGDEFKKQQQPQTNRINDQQTRNPDKGDENHQNGEKGDIAKNLNILKQCLSDKNMREILRKLIGDLNDHQQSPRQQNDKDNDVEYTEKIETDDQKRLKTTKKESTVTITGPKNAKLICIRDERESDQEQQQYEEKSLEIRPQIDIKRPPLMVVEKKQKEMRPLKLKRVETTKRRSLELLNKDKTVGIIQYNLDYHKFTQKNPMYKKTTNVQPTSLVGRISEEIMDELLIEIAEEIEDDTILENIYNAEFQYE